MASHLWTTPQLGLWMSGRLAPAVAQTRNAVKAALIARAAAWSPGLAPAPSGDPGRLSTSAAPVDNSGPLALVACSGGPDSMALAAALAFVGPRIGWRVGLVTVDHQLQEGSAQRAKSVAEWAVQAGFEPVDIATVVVDKPGGPEAAAREARYAALVDSSLRHGASCVLLGHTMDDQAETVLLSLVRGAGPRGLSGMPVDRVVDNVHFVRPLLGLQRAACRAACEAQGLAIWDDPHNVDPAYARSRLRAEVMPVLERVLGADVVPGLARAAELVGADSGYLDGMALEALAECVADGGLDVHRLGRLAPPVRSRVIQAWVIGQGATRSALSRRHLDALDALVTRWRGQGSAQLPGDLTVAREHGYLVSRRTRPAPQ